MNACARRGWLELCHLRGAARSTAPIKAGEIVKVYSAVYSLAWLLYVTLPAQGAAAPNRSSTAVEQRVPGAAPLRQPRSRCGSRIKNAQMPYALGVRVDALALYAMPWHSSPPVGPQSCT